MVAKTALVVDDSKSARLLLQKTLEKFHIQVESCASVKEALVLLDQKQPDIIFIDYVMHEINGLEAIPLIRNKKSCATIPIIMCSSQEDIEYRTRSLAHGALDFLPKPCSPRYLAHVLQKISPNFSPQKNTSPSNTSAFNLEENSIHSTLQDEFKKLSQAKKEITHNKLQTILDERLGHLRRVLLLEIESSVENTLHKTINQFEQHLDMLTEERITDQMKNLSARLNEDFFNTLFTQQLTPFKEEITHLLNSSLEKMQALSSENKNPSNHKLLTDVKNLAHFTAAHQAATAAEKIARESATAIAKTLSHEQSESKKTITAIASQLQPKMKLAKRLSIGAVVISIIALAMILLTMTHQL